MGLFFSKPASVSWFEKDTGFGAGNALANAMGAKSIGNDASGAPRFDYSGVGKPKTYEESVAPYSEGFGNIRNASEGYRHPSLFGQTYNPSTFNFQQLPQQYADTQYALGAKDINRQGAGQLQQLQEGMGTRRPGLLMKSGQQQQRNTGEQLAGLNANIRNNMINQNVQLGKEQQLQQAGENYKGYQSRSDLEKANADNAFRNQQALEGAGTKQIQLGSGLVQNDRGQMNQMIQFLLDAYLKKGDERLHSPNQGGGLGKVLGGVANAGVELGKSYLGG